jgi:putative hydrolase of the HAD superfamily
MCSAIRVVWFDVDETLYDFQTRMREALALTLAMIHKRFPATRETLDVETMVRVREDIAPLNEGAGPTLKQLRLDSFRETLVRFATPDEAFADALQEIYYTHVHGIPPPFPGVRECLRELAKRYELGVLSNGNTSPEELGIGEEVRHRVFAEDVGSGKPDRAIFEHACRIADAEPSECVLVGDNVATDVTGARGAGWHAVWFNPGGDPWPLDDPPPASFGKFTQLPGLLAGLEK